MSQRRDFINIVRRLTIVMNDSGNPLHEDSGDIYKIDRKYIVHTDTAGEAVAK